MFSYMKREPGFYKGLFALALPIILQNLINNALALADTFMVGGLGEHELSAVTLANNVFFVLILMSFGIQSGMSVLISQYWGRGDTKTINRVLGLGLMSAGGFSGVFVAAVMLFPGAVMTLTTSDQRLIELGVDYLFSVAPAFFLNSLALMLLGAFRSMENSKIGLKILTTSMLLNTLLNYIFIFGNFGAPQMGVHGAALATVISRAVEFALTLLYSLRNSHFTLEPHLLFRPGKLITRDFFKYAMPVIVNETLWGLGFTLYPIIVGHMSNAASSVAAYTVALNIDRILSAFFFGVGAAAAVVVGKHLGGDSPDGREESFRLGKVLLITTLLTGLIASSLLVLTTVFAVRPLLNSLFGMSPETAAMTWTLLLICAVNMPIRAVNFVIIVGILRGGGDVKAAAIIDICFLYLVGLPFAFTFGLLLKMGVLFVLFGILVEECAKCVVSVMRFRSGRWINNVTRNIT